jgi:hypothetical protein
LKVAAHTSSACEKGICAWPAKKRTLLLVEKNKKILNKLFLFFFKELVIL